MSSAERATELLQSLTETLALDGYLMRVEPGEPGLNVIVSAQDGACEECLVPIDVFRGIVTSYLESGGMTGETIDVTYPQVASH